MMKLNRQGLLLNAFMLAALVAVLAGPIHRFTPTWQPIYLIGASFLVAIEAGLVHHAFRREHMWLDELLRYVTPELFVMLILMRVATTLGAGIVTLGDDARRWLYDPLSIFDISYCLAILAGLLVGLLTHAAMRDLFELGPRASEKAGADADENQFLITMNNRDRSAAIARISSRFVFGGAFLLLALGIEAVNIQRVTGPSLQISLLSAIGALIYLISGFVLYSQARLTLLRSRWNLEGAKVAEAVGRRWTRTSWLLIGGVALFAALLPRAYGLGLLTTLQQTLGLIGYGLAILGYLLTSLLSLLAILPILLLSLLAGRGSESSPPMPPPLSALPDVPPPAKFEPNLLTALIFWICMLLLAIYAIGLIVQRNPGLIRALTTRGPLGWLLRQLSLLWRDTRVWAGQATARARAVLRRPVVISPVRIPMPRLSRLAPRELVRYFYRSTLQRAAAGGLPRRPGQTPYEYGAILTKRLPEARQDISELTDTFVVAEYSPHPVDEADARRARRPWERVRRRLRQLSGANRAPDHRSANDADPRE
jgi:Domain of unknown function (DUF4129)